MKAIVKRVFFDNNGLHRKGEIVEVEKIDEKLVELIIEKEPEKKAKKTK